MCDPSSATRGAPAGVRSVNIKSVLAQAPQSARGFRVCVQKWLILVRLLLGETPERAEFGVELRDALRPYLELTQAVRAGDLTAFRWGIAHHSHPAPESAW